MFDQRLVTRGIAEQISRELQFILWGLVDQEMQRGQILDYLQVFELSVDYVNEQPWQRIVHTQEVPMFQRIWVIALQGQPVNGKMWIIDSGDYATMLFPEEY